MHRSEIGRLMFRGVYFEGLIVRVLPYFNKVDVEVEVFYAS